MKKLLLLVAAFVLAFGPVFSLAHAQQSTDLSQESILDFGSAVVVNTDNSIDVTETILYNSGTEAHHGILRDIYPYSAQKRLMNIENISVTDESGVAYQFSKTDNGDDIELKIGSPSHTFTGEKTYIIKYHATRAASQLDNNDEIYWNVTGNSWPFPIEKAHATVTLPSTVASDAAPSACYYGPEGSTETCDAATFTGGKYSFTAPAALDGGEGFTVAQGFPKGILTPYTAADNPPTPSLFFPVLIAGLLPFLTFLFSFLWWRKNGKDPKGTGVIVPQYDVLDGLTPMEVAAITTQKVPNNAISAEIIYLATKGYITIAETENKILGLFNSKDYVLTKKKEFSDLPNEFDRTLLSRLFEDGGDVSLSSLRETFYTTADKVKTTALNGLVTKGYYKNLGSMKSKPGSMFALVFFAIWISVIFGSVFVTTLQIENPLPIILGIFLSVAIFAIFRKLSPSKTEKGVATRKYLLGTKDYLMIAEKDRLLFHNAPEKKPETFEALLPYAMVLGVAGIWAKEFAGIYTTPPSWYAGSNANGFNAIIFSNSLSHFSTFASSSLTSSPSSSGGSGGGGFSGGGGGGGGGGSW